MRMLTAVLACALSAPLLPAADPEFHDIVRTLSLEFQSKPIHIPMFGLVNALLFTVHPAGARHIDLAVFENVGLRGRAELTRDLDAIVSNSSRGWRPFVRVQSRHKHEQTLIYMRPDGSNCQLLLTALEPDDATVIQIKLNPEGVQRWMREPYGSAKSKGVSN